MQMNWKQTVVRVLGYGYVADPKGLRMSGITLDQFEEVFKDFRAVAVDLKFLEPDDVTIWKTGFTIANIFLFSSNLHLSRSSEYYSDFVVSTVQHL